MSVDFENASPYVGLGLSNACRKGWKFALDLGALYQNSPHVSLQQVQCGATPNCAQIQSDVAVEEAELRDKSGGYKWYPVLSIGIGYSF